MKTCGNKDCSQPNPQDLSRFHKDKTKKDGRASYCRTCAGKNSEKHRTKDLTKSNRIKRQWAINNTDKVKIAEIRKYNLTLEQFQVLYKSQNGCCSGCKRHQSELKRAMDIDHDHTCCPGNYSCGKCIRGLLCSSCNTTLGRVRDNPEILLNLALYLKNHSNKH